MTSTSKHAFTAGPASKDWWEYYLDGKVIRRSDTPLSIIRTLEDWARDTCSIKNDPMVAFIEGKPVDPRKLQREIAICISENSIDKERKRLKALEVWVIRECCFGRSIEGASRGRIRLSGSGNHCWS